MDDAMRSVWYRTSWDCSEVEDEEGAEMEIWSGRSGRVRRDSFVSCETMDRERDLKKLSDILKLHQEV